MEPFLLSPDHLVVAGVLNDVMIYSFRTLFFLSAVLLMAIVLLQEGKGGGLASALGGQGAETFGVSTGGSNKVTLFLAGLFLVSALGHALAFEQSVMGSVKGAKKAGTAPLDDGALPKEIKELLKDGEKKTDPPKEPEKPDPPKKEEK